MQKSIAIVAIFAGLGCYSTAGAYEYRQWNGTLMECTDETVVQQPVASRRGSAKPARFHWVAPAAGAEPIAAATLALAASTRIQRNCQPLVVQPVALR